MTHDARLNELREEIERIDREIVRLLADRVGTARAALGAKRAAGLPTVDPAREAMVLRRAGAAARELGLDPENVREVFRAIVQLSRRAQLNEAGIDA